MVTDRTIRGNDKYRRDSYDLERFIKNRRIIPTLELLLRRHGTHAIIHRNVNSTQEAALPPDAALARDAYGAYSGFSSGAPLASNTDPRKILTPADPLS